MQKNASDGEPVLADFTPSSPSTNARELPTYTMQEAARIKGVSYHTVSRAVRTQKLLATRLGRLVLIKRDDLDAWEPMRARATKRYPQRVPMPQETPGVIELASGERLELARRVSAVYGAIQQSALFDEPDRFTQTIAERLVVQDDRAKAVFASRGLEECVHAPPGLRNEPSGAELRADLLTTY